MEGLLTAILARHENCEIFPLKFHFLNTDVIQKGNLIQMYAVVCRFCVVRCIIIIGFFLLFSNHST